MLPDHLHIGPSGEIHVYCGPIHDGDAALATLDSSGNLLRVAPLSGARFSPNSAEPHSPAVASEGHVYVCGHEGDLFAPVSESAYDVVLFNPPYFRGHPLGGLDTAWRSEDVVERFAAELPKHLNADGYGLVVLSSDGDTAAFVEAFRRADLSVDTVAEKNLINEVLTIYRLRPRPTDALSR